MAHLLAVIVTAWALGSDLTGSWVGTLTPDGRNPLPALLVLRQEGTTVTGTAGANADDRHPLRNGKVDNGTVTFEVETPSGVMTFALKRDGDKLAGGVTRERDGEKLTATLAVQRSKDQR